MSTAPSLSMGVEPSYTPFELGFDASTKFFSDPRPVKFYKGMIDLDISGNDLCLYSKERANGHDAHNNITIVMHQYKISPTCSTVTVGQPKWTRNANKRERIMLAFLKMRLSLAIEADVPSKAERGLTIRKTGL
ncbi:hypothetical protein EVG20_g4049 [Dentipellis fragilis]|uniref:Uncharacterized protein n=1 Tax=Dentipellis fragilis TaxID=205917 RepID=A0A4Y9YY14_9AGAM|nr:hypothetical protein EVG20_g4049 [Dentipellis fragilis]